VESEPYKTDPGIGWVIAEDDDGLYMKRRMLSMEQEQSRA
jgi:hypothetical protein